VGDDGKLTEEVAKVFGVPFEVVPFKENKGNTSPKPKRHRVHALFAAIPCLNSSSFALIVVTALRLSTKLTCDFPAAAFRRSLQQACLTKSCSATIYVSELSSSFGLFGSPVIL
jgi:hypothetical protein